MSTVAIEEHLLAPAVYDQVVQAVVFSSNGRAIRALSLEAAVGEIRIVEEIWQRINRGEQVSQTEFLLYAQWLDVDRETVLLDYLASIGMPEYLRAEKGVVEEDTTDEKEESVPTARDPESAFMDIGLPKSGSPLEKDVEEEQAEVDRKKELEEHDQVVQAFWKSLNDNMGCVTITYEEFDSVYEDSLDKKGPLHWPTTQVTQWWREAEFFRQRANKHQRQGEWKKFWADTAIYLYLKELRSKPTSLEYWKGKKVRISETPGIARIHWGAVEEVLEQRADGCFRLGSRTWLPAEFFEEV